MQILNSKGKLDDKGDGIFHVIYMDQQKQIIMFVTVF